MKKSGMNKETQTSIGIAVAVIAALAIALSGYYQYRTNKIDTYTELNSLSENITRRLSVSLVEPLWNYQIEQVHKIFDAEMQDKRLFAIQLSTQSEEVGQPALWGKKRNTSWNNIHFKGYVPYPDRYIQKSSLILKGSKQNQQEVGSINVYVTNHFAKITLRRVLIKLILEHFSIIALVWILVVLGLKLLNGKRLAEEFNEDLLKTNIKMELEMAQRRRAEKELEGAKEAAEAASQAKSEFLANMSHEIRTPMNGVLAASDLALGEVLPPKVERYLNIIHSSGYSLLGIINDILDFSKIEAGKLEFEITSFDLEKLLSKITDIFIHKTSEKKIELLIDIDPDTPMSLVGDPLRLQQIITNLISNSVKFTSQGNIIVTVKKTRDAGDIKTIHFSVKDTGIGMKPDQAGNLFLPFTQADASTTRKYGGTGLGLTISKHLVEMMNGNISVESELGVGTTFLFDVELRLEKRNANRPRHSAPIEFRNKKVLIVDDSKESGIIVKRIVDSFDMVGECVESGEEALVMIEKHSYSLVIMDWMMPKLDGIMTTEIVRKRHGSDIPIIMLTAFGKEEEKRLAGEAGVNDFIVKPVNPSILYDSISGVLGVKQIKKPPERKSITSWERFSGSKVLLVEDNPTNQEIALEFLSRVDVDTTVASNGQEGVDAVKETKFDVVLMDMQMPILDGYQATGVIRNELKMTELPIIAMTAHAMKGDEEKCLSAGMNGYITKPINKDKFYKVLSSFLKAKDRSASDTSQSRDENTNDQPADKSAEPETIELPAALPGIDVQQAMDDMSLGAAVLVKIFKVFYNNNLQTADKISEAYEQNDFNALMEISHSIKGSSANIGAAELSEAARLLEDAGRNGYAKEEMVSEVLRNLSVVLNSISGVIDAREAATDDTPPVENKDVDKKDVAKALKGLYEAIDLSNPDSIIEAFKSLSHITGYENLIKELEERLESYDYDEGMEIMQQIAAKYGVPTNPSI